MGDSAVVTVFSSSSSPCSPNEIAIRPGDCVEEGVAEWLEDEALPGFRVWQLAGIVLFVLLSILVGFCCCIRFRIPRTKQEIEADYIRKKITKSFRQELSKFSNTEMDEMDLKKALNSIQSGFDMEKCHEYQEPAQNCTRHGICTRLNGICVPFAKRKNAQIRTVI